jgi:hypothetical protein
MQENITGYDVVADLEQIPWTHIDGSEGKSMESQLIFDGADGGPEATRARIKGFISEPHFHRASQFQLLLSGVMQFPTFRMDGVAVHYTDHCVAYGPHSRAGDHDFIVVHAKPAGLTRLKELENKEMRSVINRRGRHLHGSERDARTEPIPGCPGATQKTLVSDPRGVNVKILECPPGTQLNLDAPMYGRFELITKGSAVLNDRELGEETLRFVQSATPETPLRCGSRRATIIVMTYDDDAAQTYGGSLLEDLRRVLPRLQAQTREGGAPLENRS